MCQIVFPVYPSLIENSTHILALMPLCHLKWHIYVEGHCANFERKFLQYTNKKIKQKKIQT